MDLWFWATPLPLRSFPEKRCSQILSGCYPALAGEASKGVGAPPQPTIQNQRSNSCISIASPSSVSRVSSPKHLPPAQAKNSLAFRWQQPGATSRIRSGRRRPKGTTAFYMAQPPTSQPLFRKVHMFSSKVELTYREFERSVESETGAIKVHWPVTEIVVESIKTLDRKKKDSTETEGPLSGSLSAL